MAEQSVENKREIGPFSNEMKPHRASYDVLQDGGLNADTYTLFEATKDMVVKLGHVDVKRAFTSGGGATVQLGILGGDTDAFLAATAVGTLVTDYQSDIDAAGKDILLPAGSKIVVISATADLTDGKLEMVLYAHSRA